MTSSDLNFKHSHRLSIAPMLDWTNRDFRYFLRLISKHSLLYTEMVTAPALVRGGALHLLDHAPEEHPVALQLGGSDPAELAAAARLGADAGYDEINLNCGCPSDRVQSGAFGAILMQSPELVADCVAAMGAVVDVDVTVKCRIGVDEQEPQDILPAFLDKIRAAGCRRVTIHARKAWLSGLSPKENREIPPLKYDMVYKLKKEFPSLEIIINGAVTDIAQCQAHLQHVDGVMIGREAYHNPYLLAEVDGKIYGDTEPAPSREVILSRYADYCAEEIAKGTRLNHMSRHVLGLFQGKPGARIFRRYISEEAHKLPKDADVLRRAFEAMQPAIENAERRALEDNNR